MPNRASEFKNGGMSNEDRKARFKQRCMEDVANKRTKLLRSLRNAPSSIAEVGQAIVVSMQSEDPGIDPEDPHAGLTEAEYQELMASLEEALMELVEEEERVAKEAEQQMMEMFQASITLSPSEAAQAEADLAASEAAASASAEDDGSMVVAEGADAAQVSDVAFGAAGGTAVVGGPEGGRAAADMPTGVLCVLCGTMSLLQRHSVIFCASSGCGFRLDTTGDALSAGALSAQAFRVVGAHNAVCESAPGIYERHGVLFLECAECMTCEVLA